MADTQTVHTTHDPRKAPAVLTRDDIEQARGALDQALLGQRIHSRRIYARDQFDYPIIHEGRIGLPRDRVICVDTDTGVETTVAWLRSDRMDGWATVDLMKKHLILMALLNHLGWVVHGVGQMLRPTCPECFGEKCTTREVADFVGGQVSCCTIIEICDVCMGKGVLQ